MYIFFISICLTSYRFIGTSNCSGARSRRLHIHSAPVFLGFSVRPLLLVVCSACLWPVLVLQCCVLARSLLVLILPTVASGGVGFDIYDDPNLTPIPAPTFHPRFNETKLTDGDLISLMEKILNGRRQARAGPQPEPSTSHCFLTLVTVSLWSAILLWRLSSSPLLLFQLIRRQYRAPLSVRPPPPRRRR